LCNRRSLASISRLNHGGGNRHPIVQIDNTPPASVSGDFGGGEDPVAVVSACEPCRGPRRRTSDTVGWTVATGDRPPSSRERPLGVADVVRLAGRVLDGLGLVWLEGEVAQVSQPASGHLYFALRDRDSVLSAVMWGRDASRMRFRIEAGQ